MNFPAASIRDIPPRRVSFLSLQTARNKTPSDSICYIKFNTKERLTIVFLVYIVELKSKNLSDNFPKGHKIKKNLIYLIQIKDLFPFILIYLTKVLL